jgi:AraC family ethanolamine operon transcriptional activator
MKGSHAKPIAPMRITTDECAQLNELSKLNGWEADYRQVGGGKFQTSFSLYASTGIRFTDQHCNREMLVSGLPPSKHVALFLPLNPHDKGVFQGETLGINDAALICPKSEAFYRTPADLHMMIVTIPVSILERGIRSATHDDSPQLCTQTRVITLADDTISRLSMRMNHALEIAETTTDQVDANVCLQEIEQDLVSTLSLALTNPEQPERGAQGRSNRLSYLQRARDFIEANLTSPLGLQTLSQASDTSQRTLETAFREILNITIVQYIKNRRLIAINHVFLDPQHKETSVSVLAHAFGFNHMGHFAGDYRALFGELPSDTLRRQAHN